MSDAIGEFLNSPTNDDIDSFLNGPDDAPLPKSFSLPSQQASQKGGGGLLGTDLSDASNFDPLAMVARIGQLADSGNQALANLIAEQSGYAASKGIGGKQLQVPEFFGGGNVGTEQLPEILGATALGTASEFLMPQNRLGAGLTLLPGAAKGVQLLDDATIGALPKIAASVKNFGTQFLKAFPKIEERFGKEILSKPSILTEAKSVEEASANYRNAVGDLPGKTKSIAARLNKVVVKEGDFTDAIDRAGRLLNKTELDKNGVPIPLTPQDALEGVQTINRFVRNKQFTLSLDKEQLMEIGKVKNGLLDFLQTHGTPKIRSAGKELFEAYAREAFEFWLPQTKGGTTDALRSMFAAHQVVSGLSAALSSGLAAGVGGVTLGAAYFPKAAGSVIKNVAALGGPAGTAARVAGVAGANLADDDGGEKSLDYSAAQVAVAKGLVTPEEAQRRLDAKYGAKK